MPFTVTNERKEVLFHDNTMMSTEYYSGRELTERHHKLDIKAGTAEFNEICFDGLLMGFGRAVINEKVQWKATTPCSG